MGNRVLRNLAFVLFCPALFLFAGSVQAVSLEKIEVASHLGEPFYAEVPLKLESNELASKVFVEIAAPSDYKIFEVYRDPILKAIRADVASDKRGVRVELSSRSRIKSPFFNLVLKIRYGRVSHFKKFPVFLDAAKSIQQAAVKAPQPTVDAIKQSANATAPRTSLTKSAGQAFVPEPTTAVVAAVKPADKYFEGWARTDRYGPIVRGDTLSTVAERLRIDYRYTRNQIMMALFEKNSSSFDQHNINLLKAGSQLDVPTAAIVEAHSKIEATRFLVEQEKTWKKLTQQPRYAAEKEAQRTRYTKRISVGEHADGVATAPVSVAEAADKIALAAPIKPLAQPKPQTQPQIQPQTEVSGQKPLAPVEATASQAADIAAAVAQALAKSSQVVDDLRQQNTLLQEQFSDNQKSIETLNRKVENDAVTAAAAKAHLEKLEILISRLQSELEKIEQQKPASVATGMDWVIWLLIALVVILLGIVAMMMRREPTHPAVAVESAVADEPAKTISEGQSETLESVIEHEVAGIETGESELPVSKETATIDSLPVFTDELSDTDTAELEPFDADADVEPDPDIDYLAEADVYIRYGMDDEAIKQLDMALRLQPDNVEAHIKKAELLLGKSDQSGLDESVAAATMTLAAVDLERFKSSIEKLGAETDQHGPEPEMQQQQPEFDETAQDTLPLDESAADDLDFDLSELDVPDIEHDKKLDEQEHADDSHAEASEEMSWLHDAAFDGEIQQEDESNAGQQAIETGAASATQELDNLLTEFSDDENRAASEDESVTTDVVGATATEALPDFDLTGGATQELDHLLAEFSDLNTAETDAIEESTVEDSPIEVSQAGEAEGATQHLDQLLSEFDEDEDDAISFADAQHGLEASVLEQDKDEAAAITTETIGTDTDHGATQELDSLLAEFSDADEDQIIIGDATGELDESFFEPAESVSQGDDGTTGLDADHGATQELDNLLSEFSIEEEQTTDIDQRGLETGNLLSGHQGDAASGANDSDPGATQVLGHLLDEFKDAFPDDEADKKDDKKS